ncbi:MAG: hypothetical protein HFJ60_04860 [Clostridia bacterium]|jgi:hypothetical protein|nr:hypothetical protein [Clostridia bacterium]
MEENQEYISILFDLKPPKNTKHSIINTIVLFLKNIADMEDYQNWDDIDTIIFNDNIEKMKKELDNLKIIELEEK